MCTPRVDKKHPISGAMSELMSAMSALNMLPEPIPAPEESLGFVSETDAWAKHSMEHMKAVWECLVEARKQEERRKNVIFRLYLRRIKRKVNSNKGE